MRNIVRSIFGTVLALVILSVLTGVGYVAVAAAGQVPDWVPITSLIIIALVVAFGMWHKLTD